MTPPRSGQNRPMAAEISLGWHCYHSLRSDELEKWGLGLVIRVFRQMTGRSAFPDLDDDRRSWRRGLEADLQRLSISGLRTGRASMGEAAFIRHLGRAGTLGAERGSCQCSVAAPQCYSLDEAEFGALSLAARHIGSKVLLASPAPNACRASSHVSHSLRRPSRYSRRE